MITTEVREKVLSILDGAKEPIFYFDDDPDGLCAFLLLFRRNRDGFFYPVKSKPEVTERLARKAEENRSDAVFILDIARVEQEFLDRIKVPAVWIDHHPPQQRTGVYCVNPLREGQESRPTAALAYEIVQEDVWIAAIGTLNDQYWPEFMGELRAQYPDLVPSDITTIEGARFNSTIGILARVFSFSTKGARGGWLRAIRALIKVKHPDEILNQTTAEGRLLWTRYLTVDEEFQALREKAMKVVPEKGLWVFTYLPGKYSVTRELADEMISMQRESLLILGRQIDGEYRCSMRSREGPPVKPVLEYALKDVRGYGGGHERACGGCIPAEDWPRFLQRMQEGIRLWNEGELESTQPMEKDL